MSKAVIATLDEVRSLAPTTDIRTACRHLGISGSYGYELARRGDFPVKVIKCGNRYRVITASLLGLLEPSVTAEAA